jgi:hypothetical protein
VVLTVSIISALNEISVDIYQTTGRNIPEDSHLHTCHRENLKSHYIWTCFRFCSSVIMLDCHCFSSWMMLGSWSAVSHLWIERVSRWSTLRCVQPLWILIYNEGKNFCNSKQADLLLRIHLEVATKLPGIGQPIKRLTAGRGAIPRRWKNFSLRYQTASKLALGFTKLPIVSVRMFLSPVHDGRSVILFTPLNLVTRSRMSGATPPLPVLHDVVFRRRDNFTFPLTVVLVIPVIEGHIPSYHVATVADIIVISDISY